MQDDRPDAFEVLRKVLGWELTASRWDDVDGLVAALQDAFDSGDPEAFREATVELEYCGPVRAASAENPPPAPPGDRIRERVNHLIHALAAQRRKPGPSTSPARGDADPAG